MKTFVLLLLLTGLCWPAFSQNNTNFAINGNGARAAGIGYAFTGVADDASAISWNPAGLTQLYQMEASVVGRSSVGQAEVTGFKDLGIESWNAEAASAFQFNFASFVLPISVGDFNIVSGLAYRRMYDFTSELTQTITASAFGFSFQQREFYSDINGGINAIAPSLGVELNDMISVGVTANIMTGSEDGFSSQTDDQVTVSEATYALDYSGLSFDLGLLFKLNDMFSAGALITLPHSRKFTYTDFNGVDPQTGEQELSVPLFYRLGAAIRPTDRLLLAADLNVQPVSKVEFEGVTLADLIGQEDLNSLHFGLEYLLGEETIIPIRLGFYTQPLGFNDDNGDPVVAGVLTAGTGISIGTILLDASLEYARSEQVTDKTANINLTTNELVFTLGAVIHLGSD
ncbi:MAG: hypothetical protein D6677_08930 [Calditrichaeota bacterium]|nr:MAG: hypothetical protein D6677_08930 [Calditrichota bacterium]